MKVIFLDIDGVLNSWLYQRQRGADDGIIDKTRLPLLKEIVDETGAKIVLSSTWKRHWEREVYKCDFIGRELTENFLLADIEIYDKTPNMGARADEIRAWLNEHEAIESFVILDDIVFGWGELEGNLVRTNERIGRGLEDVHKRKAIEILNGGNMN